METLTKKTTNFGTKGTEVKLTDDILLGLGESTMGVDVPNINFHVEEIEGEDFLVNIEIVATCHQEAKISKGSLQIVIDNKPYEFKAQNKSSTSLSSDNPESIFYEYNFIDETNWYKIDKDLLKAICDARSLSMRVVNGRYYTEFTSLDKFQWGARVIYNATFDNSAYVDEIRQVIKQEEAKQDAKKREERKEERKKNKGDNCFTASIIIFVVGCTGSFFSLLATDEDTFLIWLFITLGWVIAAAVLFIYSLIHADS